MVTDCSETLDTRRYKDADIGNFYSSLYTYVLIRRLCLL